MESFSLTDLVFKPKKHFIVDLGKYLLWNTQTRSPVGNNQLTKQTKSAKGKAAQWITNDWNYDVSSGQIAKELQLQSLSKRRELARPMFLHSMYWEQKFLPEMHHTRKNTQTNIESSKLLQQLFNSIHSETMEFITARTSEH